MIGFQANNIMAAIRQVMQGTLGATRTVASGDVVYGLHSGFSDGDVARLTLLKPVFDVQIVGFGRSPNNLCVMGDENIYNFSVIVRIAYQLGREAIDSERETRRANALELTDTVLQALTYPGNLAETEGSVATGIVSGMLQGGTMTVSREDPKAQILFHELQFTGLALVSQGT